jgi:glycosyltransferase involved in cell wall biosynthesis
VAVRNQPGKEVILYFGNDWRADNRTSSHHIARWLAERHRVYYLECPGLRAPKASNRDSKKICAKLWRFLHGSKSVTDNLNVRTLLQIPLHRFRLVRWLNRLLTCATLRWLMWREGVENPIVWFMVPHLGALVSRLGEKLAVYYCIDDYATLPDVNYKAIRAMDEQLTASADVIFTSAESLRARKLRLNSQTFFSPHGVDVALFGQAQDNGLPVPSDTSHFVGPIVGFFGLVEEWIDLELIDFLARHRPEWTFLFIGRVAIPPSKLPSHPNLYFLGQRPYETLPAYGKQFDVAIIPFRRTEVILHANPLKLREYLAMGKPIVSVSTPEIDKYSDVVEVALTPEEFLAKLDVVLGRPASPEDTRMRMERVASESWDARLRDVFAVIERHLLAPARFTPLPGLARSFAKPGS